MAVEKHPMATGPRLEALEAVRAVLAANLIDAEPQSVAALARELRATLAELDMLNVPKGKSALDDLANRRAARRSDTPDSSPASRRSQPRRRGRNVGAG